MVLQKNVFGEKKRSEHLRYTNDTRLLGYATHFKMSLPKMPTPYGVSWQTFSLEVNFGFGVIQKSTRKLS